MEESALLTAFGWHAAGSYRGAAPMLRMFVGFILSLVLPPTYTGRVYVIRALQRHNLTIPDDLIDDIVTKCIRDAKEKARQAGLFGSHDLSNWRANQVRELNSVILSILGSRNGAPVDVFFHPAAVNDLLVSRGLILRPRKLKARFGMPICCDSGHSNGFFQMEVEEGHDITRDAIDLITARKPDGVTYLCSTCGAPIALRLKDRDKWFVRSEGDWIG